MTFGAAPDAERGLFAEFLEEAAILLDQPKLAPSAKKFREIAPRWRNLAEAALPDRIPILRQTRDLLLQQRDLYLEQGQAAKVARREIRAQLENNAKIAAAALDSSSEEIRRLGVSRCCHPAFAVRSDLLYAASQGPRCEGLFRHVSGSFLHSVSLFDWYKNRRPGQPGEARQNGPLLRLALQWVLKQNAAESTRQANRRFRLARIGPGWRSRSFGAGRCRPSHCWPQRSARAAWSRQA